MKNIETRNLQLNDFLELKEVMEKAYNKWQTGDWQEHHIQKLVEIFPEGQLCVSVDGKVAACALSIIVNYDHYGDDHTYQEITGHETFNTHDADGDVLYGIDIFVHPDYRGLRLGRRLYDARKALCENLNLKAIVAGGRIPNYHKYANEISPREYLYKVKKSEIYDPTLSFQLSNDFHVVKILRNYMSGDEESQEYATLLEWNNVFYQSRKKLFRSSDKTVRLGLVQWQMRLYSNFEELIDNIEFFIDTVSGYTCDFILFPELFNAPLMRDYNHLTEAESIRELAKYTEPLRDRFKEFAISYNVNIITGSMPLVENDRLLNVGYLCHRSGNVERFEKLHITPNEIAYWGMSGGSKLQVFKTDCARIGILICYDVEFPELPRILAHQGMDILFVPFLTDTQAGFNRVRTCAMARAVENECFVAITGSVGNLPKVKNMDIQYAQSAVFTPSDFPFPVNGIKAEATPNNEMTLIVDVDISLLKYLHHHGSVTILKDRRKDLYELKWKK